jgi:hypothetical protein
MCMMTIIHITAKKILTPLVLAVAMLFMTPVVGLLSAGLKAPSAIQVTSNETVIYKKMQSSIAFKG